MNYREEDGDVLENNPGFDLTSEESEEEDEDSGGSPQTEEEGEEKWE